MPPSKKDIPDFDILICLPATQVCKKIRKLIEERLNNEGLVVVHRSSKRVEKRVLLFFTYTGELEEVVKKVQKKLKQIGLHQFEIHLGES